MLTRHHSKTTEKIGILILFIFLILTQCGPGMLDFNERIGNTKYYYSYVDGVNKYIWRKSDNEEIVKLSVLNYKHNNQYIIAYRQVAKFYMCDESVINVAILNKYEYWIINLKSDLITGPLDKKSFYELVNKDNFLKSINLKDFDSSKGRPEMLMKDCPHRREIE